MTLKQMLSQEESAEKSLKIAAASGSAGFLSLLPQGAFFKHHTAPCFSHGLLQSSYPFHEHNAIRSLQ